MIHNSLHKIVDKIIARNSSKSCWLDA